jgi:hypothetical protein
MTNPTSSSSDRSRFLSRAPRVGDVVETRFGHAHRITERHLSPLGGRVTLYGTESVETGLPNAYGPADVIGVLRNPPA